MKFVGVMLAVVVCAAEKEEAFMKYINEFGKSYASRAEFMFRFERFMAADFAIKKINDANGTSTAGHNFTSDWTEEEFQMILSYKVIDNEFEGLMEKELQTNDLAAEVDWRDHNAVTDVKDQGQCGSCWAFSSTGALEGAHAIASGELLALAEQQLVDCAGINYGNMGCNGGRQGNAFRYTKSHPLVQESDYAYTATGGKCSFDATQAKVGSTGFTKVPKKSSDQLKAAIALQPTSVTVQANKPAFHYYTSGIVTEDCGGWHLDHAVLAVGYGSEDGQEYYLVKNSWSSSWGEDGYIRIGVEDGEGVCGIQKEALYPQV